MDLSSSNSPSGRLVSDILLYAVEGALTGGVERKAGRSTEFEQEQLKCNGGGFEIDDGAIASGVG